METVKHETEELTAPVDMIADAPESGWRLWAICPGCFEAMPIYGPGIVCLTDGCPHCGVVRTMNAIRG